MDLYRFTTGSPEETEALGERAGELLRTGDVVLLHGDLGAGKSVLARGLARGFGVRQAMPSPTFTLMQPYLGRAPFYHFDLYRLEGPEEFHAAGLDEFLGGDGAAAVEWPERAELTADSRVEIRIAPGASDRARDIAVRFFGFSRELEMLDALARWRAE